MFLTMHIITACM